MEKYILDALVNFDFSQKVVICSVIDWSGSVPRKDYPIMLVYNNEKTVGTIGGGKIEYQAIELAKSVLLSDDTIIKTFDLSSKNIDNEDGICGGQLTIVIEPYNIQLQEFWETCISSGQDSLIFREINIEERVSSWKVISPDEKEKQVPPSAKKLIKTGLGTKKPQNHKSGGILHLVLPLEVLPTLHIFGAGHVGKAVSELADFIDMKYIVYDDRTELGNSSRFPEALSINNQSIDSLTKSCEIPDNDFVLIASSTHRYDFDILKCILKSNPAYIGLLSSKHKWNLIHSRMKEEGYTANQLNRISAPVGLEIHSETVPEIAVSIIAEIIKLFRE